jgi:N-[(2S)-2-amino-2-carboxyethyl]-L-glutamate dehydrogenase
LSLTSDARLSHPNGAAPQGRAARVLSGADVSNLLAGQELGVLAAVREAYQVHGAGRTSLPHSVFLRFPESPRDRVISLPAWLGGVEPVAGMKWIASFPGNVDQGLPRASAVMVLNSCATGYPTAVLEASQVSAQRTAASAALAAGGLVTETPSRASLVGGGIINFEVARFLRVVFPTLTTFVVCDLSRARAEAFGARLERELGAAKVELVSSSREALASSSLVSLATTAVEPHIADLSMCPPDTVLLHVSLRDLAPELILAANNVVDDRDHVCRAQTSVHLAEQQVGNRDFLWCSIDELVAGAAGAPPRPGAPRIVSPFGLGILDLAVAQLVLDLATASGVGLAVDLSPPLA